MEYAGSLLFILYFSECTLKKREGKRSLEERKSITITAIHKLYFIGTGVDGFGRERESFHSVVGTKTNGRVVKGREH
jgi:hypothetical protein